MKRTVFTLFFTFFIYSISAQTLLTFEKSEGVSEYFKVTQGKLVLDAPEETGKRQWIYSIKQQYKTEWKLNIQLDFSPSSSNYVECYLMADSSDLIQSNAYVLRWGMSGNEDVLQFYEQKNGKKTKLTEGTTNLSKGGNIDVRIIREEIGEWKIYLNDSLEIEAKNTTLMTGNYIGLLCTHTATRYNLFSFDDFSIYVGKSTNIVPLIYHLHDIVFTEFLVEEKPSVFLPESQYIELYNRTDSMISLKNWSLLIDGDNLLLSAYQFLPNSYIIICPTEHKKSFLDTTNVLGIDDWKKLSSQTENIKLLSPKKREIDLLFYDQKMIDKNLTKSKGGWSLEKQDIHYFCDPYLNWKYSENTIGGTPTKTNSIHGQFLSKNAPQVDNYYINQHQLYIYFDKSVNAFEMKSVHKSLDTIIQFDQMLIFQFDTISQEEKVELKVIDCQENYANIELIIGPVKQAIKNDIFINEILVNPFEEGSEFIELYNASNHFIDLSSLVIGTWNDQDIWKDKITLPNYLFQPHTYVVLTRHKEGVMDYYSVTYPEQLIEVDLPILTNDLGTIVLANSKGDVFEKIVYTNTLHSSFLREEKGVSLERENIDCVECWKSASQTTGWASPTIENSQQFGKHEELSLQSTVITPNDDQENDELKINYVFEQESWTASFHVFSKNGYKITTFEKQTYLGKQGAVFWDLKDESQQLLSIGFYVLIVELYNEKGETKQFKFPFVIAL